jgi:Domain of unknown function (DUF4214)
MNLFQRLFQSVPRRSSNAHRLRARPQLEGLETRLAPANVSVVPVNLPSDGSHFYTLASAIAAAGPSGLVTVEPGASADSFQTPVVVDQVGITIQGDPNVPASILPAYQLNVRATAVNLQNLNIYSLVLGTATADSINTETVRDCLIGTLTSHVADSSFTQNTITGSASFDQIGLVHGGDVIANNTFSSVATEVLLLNHCVGTVIQQNTFSVQGSATAIVLQDCGDDNTTFDAGNTVPVVVANNNITVSDATEPIGITVTEPSGGFSSVQILNNQIGRNLIGRISTSTSVTGLLMAMTTGDSLHFKALVQGNDFHNDTIGVQVVGDGAHAGNIDMGGGSLGSLGGNDFRGFGLPTSLTKAAIVVSSATDGVVAAEQNIFSSGVTPSTVTFAGSGGGFSDVLNPLSSQRASVQALYNEVLGRTGSLPELDGWVGVLNAQGQAAVANGILRSSEALGHIVDAFYLRFLGRQSDPSGRAGWISFLQHGGTEEQLENLFLTSPEYQSHINTDFVQSLYINILGRTGSASELAGWNSQLQQLGLGGIASGFTQSAENRADTVLALFETFLHRVPGTAEFNAFVNSSADFLSLEAMVLSSPEYFANG